MQSSRAERRAVQDQQRAAKAMKALDPSTVATFLVVRHGETEWNAEHRLQGQLDPGLNARGHIQAEAVAQYLSDVPVDAIWSSDLSRAHQTATAIAARKGLEVHTTSKLRERHLGLIQGLTLQEAAVKQPEAVAALHAATQLPGGGESPEDVRARVTAQVEALAASYAGKRVILVVHGGVIHAMYWHTVGRPHSGRVHNASVHTFCVAGETWVALGASDAPGAQAQDDGFGGGAEEG